LSFLGRSVAGVSHELGGLLNYFSKNQQVSKKLVARFKNILEAPEFPLSQKLEEAEKIVSSYEFYLGLAERSCNLYQNRLLAELRVAQVQGNLLKSLKTLAPDWLGTNGSDS
jgi:hypothetical protein